MSETPITTTIVNFSEIPQMIENGWEIVVHSDISSKAVMSKPGAWKLDKVTQLPEILEPKKGDEGAGKPEPAEPKR